MLVAALDDSGAARPVLDVARRLAPYVGSDVVAVHVREHGSGANARAIADRAEVPLLVRDGSGIDVVRELSKAQHELHALAIVAGARRVASGAQPAGHVALRLAQELATAVVLVPPEAQDRAIRRVLVCVEGDAESDALVALIERLDDLPLFGDEPIFETEAWAREFLERVAQAPVDRVRVDVRVGNVADVVPASARDLDVDLVVMDWNCTLADGYGRIVERMIKTATVPVLLLPTGQAMRAISS
jgi:nucleotide-binding universal stress UspA family protein